MTARFVALYEKPADPDAFLQYYRAVHIPLAQQLPGLRRYEVSREITAVRGDPYFFVAELEWDSMEDLRAAFASEAGRATAADAAKLQQWAAVRSFISNSDEAG